MQTGIPYKFPICYIVVGPYSFHNQGKVLMSRFCKGFAYKSPYIVGRFSIQPPHTQRKHYNYESPQAMCNSYLHRTLVRRKFECLGRSINQAAIEVICLSQMLAVIKCTEPTDNYPPHILQECKRHNCQFMYDGGPVLESTVNGRHNISKGGGIQCN